MILTALRHRSCPPWCIEAHTGERPRERAHHGWLHSIELSTHPKFANGELPQLWLDLVLTPRDDGPLVHLQLDDLPVAALTTREAERLGLRLIGLAAVAAMETPPAAA
ncbi:hypothetical protein GCM10010116_08900 [Microbispora rosea subsp. aerata]|nr:hypothetical protein [Microbispora rosea]GGO04507.1 hypothetical protein GCM10010116_08900 [Microbispora rosea subsp. aerata]GIH56332.1 hypothetical protein Mro02_32460 [Microbispora rosea subsp. aerata]GLJ82227.1 hypothetical protein GCM10017588_09520 [Microbispora rosea subsp. aerata]